MCFLVHRIMLPDFRQFQPSFQLWICPDETAIKHSLILMRGNFRLEIKKFGAHWQNAPRRLGDGAAGDAAHRLGQSLRPHVVDRQYFSVMLHYNPK